VATIRASHTGRFLKDMLKGKVVAQASAKGKSKAEA
jgi:hypothetical protein